jgi:hypothetical protein
MNLFEGAARLVARTAEATTGAAGAVGGAVVGGAVGGVQGTVNGIRAGLSNGSHSTPAAALTLAAIGATGLVEWPLLLGIGGTALIVRQLNQGSGRETTSAPTLTAVDDRPSTAASASARARKSTTGSNDARKATPARAPRKSAASGRTASAKK